MNTLSKKIITVALSTSTLIVMSGITALPVATAQTTSVDQQINALLQQIQTIQSQISSLKGTTPSSSYNFTRNLTVGSKGDDVTALQNLLISAGDLKISKATAFFGPLTKAALVKWQKDNGVSPTSGFFGPITRAKVASVAAVASSSTGTTSSGATTTTPTVQGLAVSLAADNPAAQNIPVSTSNIISALRVNFTAGASDVTVTGLNVARGGLSADADLGNVYLKVVNGPVLATNLGISNGVINFANSGGLFTVKAGQTKEIGISVTLVGNASGHTFTLALASTTAITSNASAVSGTFPIQGNVMTGTTLGNTGNLQINNSSAATSTPGLSINAGQTNFLVGSFTLTAQNQPIRVSSITLTQTGTVGSADVVNYDLVKNGNIISTVSAINGQLVTFDLSANPMNMTSGESDPMTVQVDIPGGVFRNFQLSIQHNYDVVATDQMYNLGVMPTLTGSVSSLYPVNLSYVTVGAGTLTVSRDTNSPINYALPGGTNQTVAKIDLKASGEAIRITQMAVDLTGTAVAAGNIANVKLVDDQGQQIGTTQIAATSGIQTPISNLNYLIPANTTRVVSVILDLNSNASSTVLAGLNGILGQGYTSLQSANGPGATVAGNTLTVSNVLLSAFPNSAVGAQNIIAGAKGVKIASFALAAGAASAVTVSGFSLTTNATTSPVTSTVAADFQNLKVMVGSTQIGQTYGTLSNGANYSFSPSSQINIPIGQQIIIDVYADSLTGATWLPNPVVNLTTVSAVASATGQAIVNVNNLPVAPGLVGQVAVNVPPGTASQAFLQLPLAQQIGMSTAGVKLASWQLTGTTTEGVTLQNVYLQVTSTPATGSTATTTLFSNYKLMNGSNVVGSSAQTIGTNQFEFVGVNYTIPANGYVNLDVVADAASYASLQPMIAETASSNPSVYVSLYRIDFIGSSSGVTGVATTTANSASSTMQLLKSVFAGSLLPIAQPSIGSSLALVGAFSVTNSGPDGSAPVASLASTSLKLSISGVNTASSTTSTLVSIYDAASGGNLLGTSTLTYGTAGNITLNSSLTQISSGTTKNIYVFADISGTYVKSGTSAAQLTTTVNNFGWSDGVRTGLTANPINVSLFSTGQTVNISN